jgi:hypothetical protein
MTQLLRFIGMLLTAVLIPTGLIIAASRGIPAMTAFHRIGFDVCDGLPCFRGVVPGQSDWPEALALTADHSGDHSAEMALVSGKLTFYRHTTRPLVYSFGYFVPSSAQTSLTLAELVRAFGPPCRVQFGMEWKTRALLIYQFGWAITTSADGRLNADSRITDFTFTDPGYLSDLYPAPNGCPGLGAGHLRSSWRGFAILSHYRRAGALN